MLTSCERYDRFHAAADRIYRIVVDQVEPDGSIVPTTITPAPLRRAVLREVPEIEQATHLHISYWGKSLFTHGNK